MKNKILKAIMATGMASMVFSMAAFAGTKYESYNTTVGKFNGNGYSGYQTKSSSGESGQISSTKVGGDYVVDARMNSRAGNGNWLGNLDDNEVRLLPGNDKLVKGTDVRVQFSNDWNTPVAVQVVGKWKSN